MTDLADPEIRAALVTRLGRLYDGRPVVLGPGVLAGHTSTVAGLLGRGCRVLVLATTRGAGDIPRSDDCTVVDLDVAPAASVTDELRAVDHLAHHLPDHVVAAIEAFDPQGQAIWNTGHFVTSDEPILGRQVVGGRPAAWLAMEDKILAEQIWVAAGVPAAPHVVVPVDPRALADATVQVAGRLGAVWSGDARDGFNGGGNYVRWVADDVDQQAAYAFFEPRCDRVRVMPFLDGVPCSIHGIVVPDGTAVFRPVEIAMLRNEEAREFVYGGLSTYWDPPAADREEMRALARRVGDHLQAEYGYRGAFGVDGVLTADGFRPTELNTRMSAGLATVGSIDRELFSLAQEHLVAGLDTGLSVADLESLLPVVDGERTGRAVAIGAGVTVPEPDDYPVHYDGTTLERTEVETGDRLVIGNTPTGFFAKINPCSSLRPGDRVAPLNAALMDFLDREYGAGLGPVTAPPDVRRGRAPGRAELTTGTGP